MTTTTPAQASLELPATFAASFWPSYPTYPSYRSALVHLFTLLQAGLDEDVAIVSFVKQVIESHWALVDHFKDSLGGSAAASSSAFVASQIQASKPVFREARSSTSHQHHASLATSGRGPASLIGAMHATAIEPLIAKHVRTANSLARNILEPFGEWSQTHAQRVTKSWQAIEEWLDTLEKGQDELDRLRTSYESKCRQADEAEDDARFSGVESDATFRGHGASAAEDESRQAHAHGDLHLPTATAEPTNSSTSEESLDPVKLERRQTLRRQFGFTPRIPSAGSESDKGKHTSTEEIAADSGSPAMRTSATFTAALNSALSAPALKGIKDRIASAAGAGGVVERWRRLRKEADRLEVDYMRTAQNLDTIRCRLEDIISEQLSLLQRFETDRLASVKTVLSAYSSAMGGLHPSLAERTQKLVQNHGSPDALIARLIASASTGNYRPLVEIFHPYYHDGVGNHPSSSAVGFATGWAGFGMDLNAKWRNDLLARTDEDDSVIDHHIEHKTGASIPLSFSQLLASLERAYQDDALWSKGDKEQANDELSSSLAASEKRRTWVYDVPLPSSHACRESIIRHVSSSYPGAELGAGLPTVLEKFDPPTRAATLKIWLAELQDCVIGEENWHIVTSLYRAAESVEQSGRAQGDAVRSDEGDAAKDVDGSQRNAGPAGEAQLDDAIKDKVRRGVLDDLAVVLNKLSSIQLTVLDSLLSHLRDLIRSTRTSGESDEVYMKKLALSIGPLLLRPKHVTRGTQASKIPTRLMVDLLAYYDDLLPPALARKNKKEEAIAVMKRQTPRRKRTKAPDQRIRRSQLRDNGENQRFMMTVSQNISDEPATLQPHEELKGSKVISGTDVVGQQRSIQGDGEASLPVLPPSESSEPDVPSVVSSQGIEGATSIYNTPRTELASPLDEGPSLPSATTSYRPVSRPASPQKPQSESQTAEPSDDVPLSNVARLSRQFNTSTSGSSKRLSRLAGAGSGAAGAAVGSVRGPRSANKPAAAAAKPQQSPPEADAGQPPPES
ncbi:unnamed protein product [Parajaminaea phylloscopi]